MLSDIFIARSLARRPSWFDAQLQLFKHSFIEWEFLNLHNFDFTEVLVIWIQQIVEVSLNHSGRNFQNAKIHCIDKSVSHFLSFKNRWMNVTGKTDP